jgi:hypothetical protein
MPNDRETRIAALEKQLAELKVGKSGGKWHTAQAPHAAGLIVKQQAGGALPACSFYRRTGSRNCIAYSDNSNACLVLSTDHDLKRLRKL